MPSKLSKRDRLKVIKRIVENKECVTKVCNEKKISRTVFYRWLRQYKKDSSILSSPTISKLSPNKRREAIERVVSGEGVTKICKLYGVSRPVLYKWLNRYNSAPEGKKLEALWDKKPKIDKYFNQAPEEYEKAVLVAVAKYPELSSHKLVWILPQVGGRPILGNHGVQNVLRRHNLNTYEQRLAYAQDTSRLTRSTAFFKSITQLLSFAGRQTPSLRRAIFRGGFIVSLAIFASFIIYGTYSLLVFIGGTGSITYSTGLLFAITSLTFGMFFFLYSLKYYITIAMVLSFSRYSGEEREEEERKGSFLEKIFGIKNATDNSLNNRFLFKNYEGGAGLEPDLSNISLTEQPFVSIHLATYNEKKVIDRLLTAATSMDYENYEVVIVDDSNDETVKLLEKWKKHPRVKVVNRPDRTGYKGGALSYALKAMDKRTQFICVFDADFIPYPDSITQFLKYFKHSAHGLDEKTISKSNIAVIQGYQWHVLNKSENWVTRGVRSEYAGSYVIERSGVEIYSGLKQISGSVYMIRADVLKKIGWGTSITEDFQLTLKLYNAGYKVVYTPYIQAPAEAVSTIKRLIRQRMRWAEGHSHNIRKMFKSLFFNKDLSFAEKLEFVYLTPYYLQALFFILGTFSWFMAEAVFQVHLPFWTSLWGWSLVFGNMFALPLMNMVGLFLEEAEERDYLGLLSFVALSYVIAPFQGYSALKGFIQKEEGPWFRTPKTGKITDIFIPGKFYRYIFGFLGGRVRPANSTPVTSNMASFLANNKHLALATANNRFDSFSIPLKRRRFIARAVLSILLIFSMTLLSLTRGVPEAFATLLPTTQYLTSTTTATLNNSWKLDSSMTTSESTTAVAFLKGDLVSRQAYRPGASGNFAETACANGNATGYGWILDTPFEAGGTVASGAWSFTFYESDTPNAQPIGNLEVCAYKVTVSGGAITGSTLIFNTAGMAAWATTDIIDTVVSNSTYTTDTISQVDFNTNEYIYVQFALVIASTPKDSTSSFFTGDVTGTLDPMIVFPTITIPENGIILAISIPVIISYILWMRKKKKKPVFSIIKK